MTLVDSRNSIAGIPQKRRAKKLAQIARTACGQLPACPIHLHNAKGALLYLPDNVLVAILELLDWKHRLIMVNVCRRLKNVANDAPWMRCARFTLQDPPTVFTVVMVRPRTDVITELDVGFYVLTKSERVAEALSLCTNLVVLRCVHSRILPTTMVLLLKDKLRKLECLHWSVLKDTTADIKVPDFLARNLEGLHYCDCSVLPPNMKTMYVEVFSTTRNINFLCSVLGHCHALKSLHFHERRSETEGPGIACRVLRSYADGSRGNFQDFTYTTECSPSDMTVPRQPMAMMSGFFKDFGRCIDVCKGITLHLHPKGRRNCVTISELDLISVEDMASHRQLILLVNECGNDAITQLNNSRLCGKFYHLRALTLMALPEAAAMFRCNRRKQAALCNFIRSCVALTELNLSAFHFSEDFNWSSMLATGGLDNLRSLALVACALCSPRRLQFIGRASFKLRELDVRSFPDVQGGHPCDVCRRATTCDDVALAPLQHLRYLERLTLCEMLHARTLLFLVGCTSVRELRLVNMGTWSSTDNQDMTPILSLWPQLYALKLESSGHLIDFSLLKDLPETTRMRRLCLSAVTVDGKPMDNLVLATKLRHTCPAVSVIHVHRRNSVGTTALILALGKMLDSADDTLVDSDDLWISSVNKVWLCDCVNYIGVPSPQGVK